MSKGNEGNMERVRQKRRFNCMAVLLRETRLSGRAGSTNDKREFIINRNVWSFQSRRNSVLFFSPFRFYSRKILQPHWDWPPPRKKKYLQEDIPFQGVNGWRTGVSGAQACQEEIEIATFTRHFVPVMNNGDINWRRSISYVKRLTNI